MNSHEFCLYTKFLGPTCDSTDVLCQDIQLELLQIDDIVYFNNMGAYTLTINTPFNGFGPTQILHFRSSDESKELDSSTK